MFTAFAEQKQHRKHIISYAPASIKYALTESVTIQQSIKQYICCTLVRLRICAPDELKPSEREHFTELWSGGRRRASRSMLPVGFVLHTFLGQAFDAPRYGTAVAHVMQVSAHNCFACRRCAIQTHRKRWWCAPLPHVRFTVSRYYATTLCVCFAFAHISGCGSARRKCPAAAPNWK